MVEDMPHVLETLLDAPNPELRASAAFALGSLLLADQPADADTAAAAAPQHAEAGPQQREVVEWLVRSAGDGSPLVRSEAAVALARFASTHRSAFQVSAQKLGERVRCLYHALPELGLDHQQTAMWTTTQGQIRCAACCRTPSGRHNSSQQLCWPRQRPQQRDHQAQTRALSLVGLRGSHRVALSDPSPAGDRPLWAPAHHRTPRHPADTRRQPTAPRRHHLRHRPMTMTPQPTTGYAPKFSACPCRVASAAQSHLWWQCQQHLARALSADTIRPTCSERMEPSVRDGNASGNKPASPPAADDAQPSPDSAPGDDSCLPSGGAAEPRQSTDSNQEGSHPGAPRSAFAGLPEPR